jgi:putative membrane protein insertion efficiency factor
MVRIILLCISLHLITFNNLIYSQIKENQELLTLFRQPDSVKQTHGAHLKKASNEFDILVSTGFLVYKKTISSQDQPSCVFTPSCSEYAVDAFQKNGLITGWLQTFDRLSRCHSFVHHSHYHFDKEKNRFYDPVQ